MADVDGFDFGGDWEEEFRRRVPFGGIAGGLDPTGGLEPAPQPAPANQPEPEPAAQPAPAAFNPFGGEEEARTKASLDAFRNEARSRGLAVDAGDREAYAQMQSGFGALPSLIPEIAQAQSSPLPLPIQSYHPTQPIDNGGVWMNPPVLPPPVAAAVPDQFDDPYTNLLEQVAKSQMGQVRDNPGLNQLTSVLQNQLTQSQSNPELDQFKANAQKQLSEVRSNPALDQLTAFLNQQFQGLSQTPGYAPEELAVLNTQLFEPIEERRKAAQQRSVERMAARGFLPSSGIGEIDARNIDQDFDKLRTVADRDLAVQAIDRRDADLNRAQQIATLLGNDLPAAQRTEELRLSQLLGVDLPQTQRKEQLGLAQLLGSSLPQQQRSEELALANLLYGLPRNALSDSLAVLNGSPQAQNLYQGAGLLQQQQYIEQQQNAARWNAIAEFLAGIL